MTLFAEDAAGASAGGNSALLDFLVDSDNPDIAISGRGYDGTTSYYLIQSIAPATTGVMFKMNADGPFNNYEDINGSDSGILFQVTSSDNSTRAFIGKKDGAHLDFDGTNMYMSSSAFFLGGGGQFLSGSGGNIEISSSNFHLQPGGDVIMSGKIRATSGDIGGFDIESNQLSSVTGNVNANASSSLSPFVIDLNSRFGIEKNQLNITNTTGKQSFMELKNQYDVGKADFQQFRVENFTETTSSILSLISHIDDTSAVTSSITMKVGSYRGEAIRPSFSGAPNVARFNIVNTQVSHSFSSITELSNRGAAGGAGFIYEGGERFSNFFVGNKTTQTRSGYIKTAADSSQGLVRLFNISENGAFGLGVDPFTRAESHATNAGILQTISASFFSSTLSGSTEIEKASIGTITGASVFTNGLRVGIASLGATLTKEGSIGLKLTVSGSSVFEAIDQNLGGLGRVAYTVFNQNGLDTDFRIESSGDANMFYVDAGNDRIGIKDSTPSYTVDINGEARTTGEVTIDKGLGVGTAGTTTVGLIRATNDVVAFYSSDRRLKDNLVKLGNPLDKVSQLNGYEFDWIAKEGIHENEGHDIGVIAQEVEKVMPEIVQTRDNGYKAVKYEKIVPLLIESIKEQQKQIDELKKEVEELKNA